MFILFFLLKDSLARYRILVSLLWTLNTFKIFSIVFCQVLMLINLLTGHACQNDSFPVKMTVIPFRIIGFFSVITFAFSYCIWYSVISLLCTGLSF